MNLRPVENNRGLLRLVNPSDLTDQIKFQTKQKNRTLYGHPQTANQAEWVFNWDVPLSACGPDTCKTGVERDSIRVYISHSLETKSQMIKRLQYAISVIEATSSDMISGFTPIDTVIEAFEPEA